MKKIINIVFYQFFGTSNSEKQACIFYDDGSFEKVSFQEGIDACEVIAKEKNIHTKEAFRELINNDMIHVMSGADFEKKFASFFPTTEKHVEEEKEEEAVVEEEKKEKVEKSTPVVAPIVEEEKKEATEDKEDLEEIVEEEPVKNDADVKEEKEEEIDNSEISTEEKPKGFFRRAWEKFKNSKIAKRVVLCVTAIAVGLGIYSLAKRQSKTGQMNNSNLSSITSQTDLNYQNNAAANTNANANTTNANQTVSKANASRDYEAAGSKFRELINRTKNVFQKGAMINADLALKNFNGEFADHYLEEGKDIRASLTFDEVVALQNAYNDYSKEQLKAYFNGADIDASKLTRNYKDATLQLMGAHVIETREHPVDMSMLIDSQEGKDFYNKYHELFLQCKEAKGDEKVSKVKQFYDMVRKDFYLSEQLRTEGISHAEIHNIESYKLSVTPMIAASEMLFQNLRVDETLNDQEVEFFNSIGLCNIASAHFRRIETISLSTEVDKENPLYEEYRNAIIEKYQKLGIYYIDDAHRELSKLDRFRVTLDEQNERNRHIGGHGGVPAPGQPSTKVTTEEEIETKTEEVVTTTEETKTVEVKEEEVPEEKREELKEEVDKEIEDENEEAKRKAEEEAEKERQRQQAEEDKKRKEIEEQVKQDEEKLQQDIDDANKKIEEGKVVTEDDFKEEKVVFDEDHSHDGVLDPSVKDITTDPTGDKTGDPMPNPEDTGREFDQKAPKNENPSTSTSESTVQTSEGTITSVQVPEGTVIDEFWVEEEPVNNTGSNERAVDAYIASLENQNNDNARGYQYRRA